MSFRDEDHELPKGRRSETPLRKIAAGVIFAAMAYGVWQGLGWVIRAANPPETAAPAPEEDPGEVKVELVKPGATPEPAPTPAQLARLKQIFKTAPPDESGTVAITPLPAEKRPARPTAKLVKEWRMRGHVYNLVTLAPVSLCPMVFSDIQTNARYETMTDAQGRYRVILPPLPDRGYTVMITGEGYAANYYKPEGEDVGKKSLKERRALALETSRSMEGPASLAPESSAPLLTDFYLAPTDLDAR